MSIDRNLWLIWLTNSVASLWGQCQADLPGHRLWVVVSLLACDGFRDLTVMKQRVRSVSHTYRAGCASSTRPDSSRNCYCIGPRLLFTRETFLSTLTERKDCSGIITMTFSRYTVSTGEDSITGQTSKFVTGRIN
jgi:hypothetical protein